MFRLQCIDNHAENSATSRSLTATVQASPSPDPCLLRFLSSGLWRDRRGEPWETGSPHGTLLLSTLVSLRETQTSNPDTSHTARLLPSSLPASLLLPRLIPRSAHLPPWSRGTANMLLPQGLRTSGSWACITLSSMFTPSFLPIFAQEWPHPAGLPGYLYVKQQTSPLPVWAFFIFIRAQVYLLVYLYLLVYFSKLQENTDFALLTVLSPYFKTSYVLCKCHEHTNEYNWSRD